MAPAPGAPVPPRAEGRPLRLLAPLYLLVAASLTLAGCGYEDEIAQVKQAKTGGIPNERMVNDLAGARGAVSWSARTPEAGDPAFAADADVVLVVATIDKPRRDGQPRTAAFIWAYNRGTEQIALERFAIDGTPQDIAGGLLNLLLMQLE